MASRTRQVADATVQVRTVTGDDGKFCLAVDPGQYLLQGIPPEQSDRPPHTDIVDVESVAVMHDLTLPPVAFVTGVVKGPDGTPLKLARVRAFSPVLSSSEGALQLGETISGDDGTFTLRVPNLMGLGQRN